MGGRMNWPLCITRFWNSFGSGFTQTVGTINARGLSRGFFEAFALLVGSDPSQIIDFT